MVMSIDEYATLHQHILQFLVAPHVLPRSMTEVQDGPGREQWADLKSGYSPNILYAFENLHPIILFRLYTNIYLTTAVNVLGLNIMASRIYIPTHNITLGCIQT